MKPAAIAATLLLHTATLGAFYHFSSTEAAAHKGQTAYTVALLQGDGVATVPADRHTPGITPSAQSDTPNAQLSQEGSSGVAMVSIPANYSAVNQKPVYPLLSRKQDEQGTVVLRILVKEDGSPGEVRIQQSSGYPLLDESALSAVRQWRFHPASVNRRPIAEWYQVAIPFKLQQ